MNGLMQLGTYLALNRLHRSAPDDLRDGHAQDPELLDLKLRQLMQAENDLTDAINRLLEKYAEAEEAAIAARPMPALYTILNETLIHH